MDAKAYEFGDFRLDPADCILRCGGEPVPLTPKAFDLLLLLIENRSTLVTKEVIMKRLWPDAVVDEGASSGPVTSNLPNGWRLRRMGETSSSSETPQAIRSERTSAI